MVKWNEGTLSWPWQVTCQVSPRSASDGLAPYNVAAIFHGHLHARRTDMWDGLAIAAPQGIPVFGAKNAGAGGANRAFFYCRIEGADLVVREYQSIGEEGWSHDRSEIRWEPRVWRAPLRRKTP